jgi:hypothetical protein
MNKKSLPLPLRRRGVGKRMKGVKTYEFKTQNLELGTRNSEIETLNLKL